MKRYKPFKFEEKFSGKIRELKYLYHGTISKKISKFDFSYSQQKSLYGIDYDSISVSDSLELAKMFTKGELGDKLFGSLYQLRKKDNTNFKLYLLDTKVGNKLITYLIENDFDGIDFKTNYEEFRTNFYPGIDKNKIKNSSEIRLINPNTLEDIILKKLNIKV